MSEETKENDSQNITLSTIYNDGTRIENIDGEKKEYSNHYLWISFSDYFKYFEKKNITITELRKIYKCSDFPMDHSFNINDECIQEFINKNNFILKIFVISSENQIIGVEEYNPNKINDSDLKYIYLHKHNIDHFNLIICPNKDTLDKLFIDIDNKNYFVKIDSFDNKQTINSFIDNDLNCLKPSKNIKEEEKTPEEKEIEIKSKETKTKINIIKQRIEFIDDILDFYNSDTSEYDTDFIYAVIKTYKNIPELNNPDDHESTKKYLEDDKNKLTTELNKLQSQTGGTSKPIKRVTMKKYKISYK